MGISGKVRRMDSMMIESNIRRMGRLELLYTCLSNLVKRINKDGRKDLMSGLEHYADQDDRNRVVYHDSSVPQSERIQKVIDDASSLLPKCASDYSGTDDYQLLERAIREQTKKGWRRKEHITDKRRCHGFIYPSESRRSRCDIP